MKPAQKVHLFERKSYFDMQKIIMCDSIIQWGKPPNNAT